MMYFKTFFSRNSLAYLLKMDFLLTMSHCSLLLLSLRLEGGAKYAFITANKGQFIASNVPMALEQTVW